jgi:hypothetical protein
MKITFVILLLLATRLLVNACRHPRAISKYATRRQLEWMSGPSLISHHSLKTERLSINGVVGDPQRFSTTLQLDDSQNLVVQFHATVIPKDACDTTTDDTSPATPIKYRGIVFKTTDPEPHGTIIIALYESEEEWKVLFKCQTSKEPGALFKCYDTSEVKNIASRFMRFVLNDGSVSSLYYLPGHNYWRLDWRFLNDLMVVSFLYGNGFDELNQRARRSLAAQTPAKQDKQLTNEVTNDGKDEK